jgi:hypothetical protein
LKIASYIVENGEIKVKLLLLLKENESIICVEKLKNFGIFM